jgi:hypothetical protein
MAQVLCQYNFDVNIACFLKEGEWNRYTINAFNVPFDLTACTPFSGMHAPVTERKNSDKKKKVKQI